MRRNAWKLWAGVAAVAAVGLLGAAVASGAGTTPKTSTTPTAPTARTPETPLTGDVLAKVTAAAIAKVGGTVDAATTENDSPNAAAKYEAHLTKADGTHVTVVLDAAYAVLSVETGGPGGRGGLGPGGGDGETPLTGDVATKAKAAALAKVGGTADAATTENDGSNAAAAYEVHVTKTDGTHVTVILDKDYDVLSVETGGPRGHGFH
jgi:uncharacterized membrane protein YkoI